MEFVAILFINKVFSLENLNVPKHVIGFNNRISKIISGSEFMQFIEKKRISALKKNPNNLLWLAYV
jgi:hypothetical protein